MPFKVTQSAVIADSYTARGAELWCPLSGPGQIKFSAACSPCKVIIHCRSYRSLRIFCMFKPASPYHRSIRPFVPMQMWGNSYRWSVGLGGDWTECAENECKMMQAFLVRCHLTTYGHVHVNGHDGHDHENKNHHRHFHHLRDPPSLLHQAPPQFSSMSPLHLQNQSISLILLFLQSFLNQEPHPSVHSIELFALAKVYIWSGMRPLSMTLASSSHSKVRNGANVFMPWSHLGHIALSQSQDRFLSQGGKVSPGTYGDDTSSVHRYLRLAGMLFLGKVAKWELLTSWSSNLPLYPFDPFEPFRPFRAFWHRPSFSHYRPWFVSTRSPRPGSCMAEPLRHAVPRKLQLSHPTDISSSGEALDFFSTFWMLRCNMFIVVHIFSISLRA